MIILRPGTTQFDLAAMADAYQRQGTARTTLIEALRLHIRQTCPDLSVGAAERQVTLAANAIFVRVGQPTMGSAIDH